MLTFANSLFLHDDDACVLTTKLVKVLYSYIIVKKALHFHLNRRGKNLANKIKNNHTDSLVTILVSPTVHNFVFFSLLVALVAIPLLFITVKPFF
jgi:hypothetical protein